MPVPIAVVKTLFIFYFFTPYFSFLNIKYDAITSNPAVTNTASNPGIPCPLFSFSPDIGNETIEVGDDVSMIGVGDGDGYGDGEGTEFIVDVCIGVESGVSVGEDIDAGVLVLVLVLRLQMRLHCRHPRFQKLALVLA